MRNTITGGQGYRLKLASNMGSAEQIVQRLGGDMDVIQQQLQVDQAVVARIQNRLGQGQVQSRQEIDALVERLMVQYERTIYQVKSEFRDGLSIFVLAKRSFLSIFNRKQRVESWLNDLKARAQSDLEATLDETSKEGAKRFLDGNCADDKAAADRANHATERCAEENRDYATAAGISLRSD